MAKITGVKKEAIESANILKVKLNKESLIKAYGSIPTVIYINGSRIDCSTDELEIKTEVANILRAEGVIE